jgi:hypothetical protein
MHLHHKERRFATTGSREKNIFLSIRDSVDSISPAQDYLAVGQSKVGDTSGKMIYQWCQEARRD